MHLVKYNVLHSIHFLSMGTIIYGAFVFHFRHLLLIRKTPLFKTCVFTSHSSFGRIQVWIELSVSTGGGACVVSSALFLTLVMIVVVNLYPRPNESIRFFFHGGALLYP